uniref:Uncharacterized protein n=1 Tax=Quercus lobata TaxID=97700 RepID=A0A7N2KZF8_QUELO
MGRFVNNGSILSTWVQPVGGIWSSFSWICSKPCDGKGFLDFLVVGTFVANRIEVLADILPRETLRWKLQMLKSGSAVSNSCLHTVKAQTLILSSHFFMELCDANQNKFSLADGCPSHLEVIYLV